MPHVLKNLSAYNFVSSHGFDYPQGMSAGKKHSNQFLASLSGHLHKVDIICRFAKTRFAQTLAKRHNVLFRSPRKRSTKQIKWCFLSPRTFRCGLLNLGKRQIIKIAERLFLEIRAFFYLKM